MSSLISMGSIAAGHPMAPRVLDALQPPLRRQLADVQTGQGDRAVRAGELPREVQLVVVGVDVAGAANSWPA
jgi:hypothetical protein